MATCSMKCEKACVADKCDKCYKEILRWNGIEGILKLEIMETEDAIEHAEEKLQRSRTFTPAQRQDWEYLCYVKLPQKLVFLKKQLQGERLGQV